MEKDEDMKPPHEESSLEYKLKFCQYRLSSGLSSNDCPVELPGNNYCDKCFLSTGCGQCGLKAKEFIDKYIDLILLGQIKE